MSNRNRNPTGRIGRLAMMRLTAKRLSLLCCPDVMDADSAMYSLEISRRKYQITAIREPKCTAVSKASPWSGHPRTKAGRIRCAELEIGRNSVMPWIRARQTACRKSKFLFFYANFMRGTVYLIRSRTWSGIKYTVPLEL